jgi:hypothetical protein
VVRKKERVSRPGDMGRTRYHRFPRGWQLFSWLIIAGRAVIFAWQVLDNQLHDLAYLLEPSYLHVGVGRDDGKTAGEAVPIFWRKWIYTC